MLCIIITAVKHMLSDFQSTLYCYYDGNICEQTMFNLTLSSMKYPHLFVSQKMFCIIWILFTYILQTLWQYKVDLNSPNLHFNVCLFNWTRLWTHNLYYLRVIDIWTLICCQVTVTSGCLKDFFLNYCNLETCIF